MPGERATTGTPEEAAFLPIANALARSSAKGRSGLGAFRKYDALCRDTARVVFESSIFESTAIPGITPALIDEDLLFHFLHRRRSPACRYLLEQVLVRPGAFDPAGMWAVFWALIKAEHQFLLRYVPYWSNEERLTGHLVSQIVERVEEFGDRWNMLTRNSPSDRQPLCRVFYADTATARRESSTGADLALIVQCRFGWHDEFFKVARFQAKKAGRDGKATIDLDQVGPLGATENLGYYLFYHYFHAPGWSPTPTVRSAGDFADLVEEAEKEKKARGAGLGTKQIDARSSGFDFAAFVTFGLCDPGAERGVLASSAGDAVSTAMSSNRGPMPSRILVITVGEGATDVAWHELLREYVGGDQD